MQAGGSDHVDQGIEAKQFDLAAHEIGDTRPWRCLTAPAPKRASDPERLSVGVFRQKIHFVLRGKTDDFRDIREIVQLVEQRFELLRRRHPE